MSIQQITWEHVVTLIAVILAIVAGYNAVMSAIKNHNDAKKRKNEPVNKLEEQVTTNTEILKQHEAQLKENRERLEKLETQQRIQLRGMMALLSHEVNGNSVDKLRASIDEITNWLMKQ